MSVELNGFFIQNQLKWQGKLNIDKTSKINKTHIERAQILEYNSGNKRKKQFICI